MTLDTFPTIINDQCGLDIDSGLIFRHT